MKILLVKRNIIKIFAFIFVMFIASSGCYKSSKSHNSHHDNNEHSTEKGKLSIFLLDFPLNGKDVKNVNINIKKIQIKSGSENEHEDSDDDHKDSKDEHNDSDDGHKDSEDEYSDSDGWHTLVDYGDSGRTFDLLKLQNGKVDELGTFVLNAGVYNQIRLILNRDNEVILNDNGIDVSKPLKIPSGEHTGIKLVKSFEIKKSGITSITIDFDAEKSISYNKGQGYMLKPVIKIIDAVTLAGFASEDIKKDKGGTVNISDIANLNIPAGVLSNDATITMFQGVNSENIAGKEDKFEDIMNITLLNVVDFTTANVTMNGTMSLTMNYTDEIISQLNQKIQYIIDNQTDQIYKGRLINESDLDIYYFDTVKGSWIKTNGVINTSANTITANISILGIYAVGFSFEKVTGFNKDDFPPLNHSNNHDSLTDNALSAKTDRTCSKIYDSDTLAFDAYSIQGRSESVCDSPNLECSGPGKPIDYIYNGLFSESCAYHDCCYRRGLMTYGFQKNYCDSDFYGRLRNDCSTQYPLTKKLCTTIKIGFFPIKVCIKIFDFGNLIKLFGCKVTATVMYLGVYFGGIEAWNNGVASNKCYDYLHWGVDCSANRPPFISDVRIGKLFLNSGEVTKLEVIAGDPNNGDLLDYNWSSDCIGSFTNNDNISPVTYWSTDAGPEGKSCTITIQVTDNHESDMPEPIRHRFYPVQASVKVMINSDTSKISWAYQIGSSDDDTVYSIVDINDYIYIAGHTNGFDFDPMSNIPNNPFIMKFSKDGNEIDRKVITINLTTIDPAEPNDIKFDKNGNLYCLYLKHRAYTNEMQFVAEIILKKFDLNGTLLWEYNYGTGQNIHTLKMNFDSENNIYFTGTASVPKYTSDASYYYHDEIYFMKYNIANKNIEFIKSIGENESLVYYKSADCFINNSDVIFIYGETVDGFILDFPELFMLGYQDNIVLQYNKYGTLLSSQQFGTRDGQDYSKKIFGVRNDNFYLTGYSTGSADNIFVKKFNSNISLMWDMKLGNNIIESISNDNNDYLYIAGGTWLNLDPYTNKGKTDAYMMKYDQQGNKLSTRVYGTNGSDSIVGMTIDSKNDIYAIGLTDSLLFPIKHYGKRDIFIIKFLSD